MANLYKRPGSIYWWIKWTNPETRKKERLSTKIEHGTAIGWRMATAMCNKYTAKQIPGRIDDYPFTKWVPNFLKTIHADVPSTLARNLTIWNTLAAYLSSINVRSPLQLRREQCLKYIEWRQAQKGFRGNNGKISKNTIIMELRTLSKIMSEAVNRTWIESNPCWKLNLKKEKPRVKDEMTDEHIQKILNEIDRLKNSASNDIEKQHAEYFRVSFEIARLQGVRLKETHINLFEDVNWKENKIRIKSKTGLFETYINPNLMPLLKDLKRQGKIFTHCQPKRYTILWWDLFSRLRKKDPSFNRISFHSTRVTVVSRIERAGAPENISMTLVNHASTTIHRVYRRFKAHEVAPFWNHVSSPPSPLPVPSEDKPSTSKNQDDPQST